MMVRSTLMAQLSLVSSILLLTFLHDVVCDQLPEQQSNTKIHLNTQQSEIASSTDEQLTGLNDRGKIEGVTEQTHLLQTELPNYALFATGRSHYKRRRDGRRNNMTPKRYETPQNNRRNSHITNMDSPQLSSRTREFRPSPQYDINKVEAHYKATSHPNDNYSENNYGLKMPHKLHPNTLKHTTARKESPSVHSPTAYISKKTSRNRPVSNELFSKSSTKVNQRINPKPSSSIARHVINKNGELVKLRIRAGPFVASQVQGQQPLTLQNTRRLPNINQVPHGHQPGNSAQNHKSDATFIQKEKPQESLKEKVIVDQNYHGKNENSNRQQHSVENPINLSDEHIKTSNQDDKTIPLQRSYSLHNKNDYPSRNDGISSSISPSSPSHHGGHSHNDENDQQPHHNKQDYNNENPSHSSPNKDENTTSNNYDNKSNLPNKIQDNGENLPHDGHGNDHEPHHSHHNTDRSHHNQENDQRHQISDDHSINNNDDNKQQPQNSEDNVDQPHNNYSENRGDHKSHQNHEDDQFPHHDDEHYSHNNDDNRRESQNNHNKNYPSNDNFNYDDHGRHGSDRSPSKNNQNSYSFSPNDQRNHPYMDNFDHYDNVIAIERERAPSHRNEETELPGLESNDDDSHDDEYHHALDDYFSDNNYETPNEGDNSQDGSRSDSKRNSKYHQNQYPSHNSIPKYRYGVYHNPDNDNMFDSYFRHHDDAVKDNNNNNDDFTYHHTEPNNKHKNHDNTNHSHDENKDDRPQNNKKEASNINKQQHNHESNNNDFDNLHPFIPAYPSIDFVPENGNEADADSSQTDGVKDEEASGSEMNLSDPFADPYFVLKYEPGSKDDPNVKAQQEDQSNNDEHESNQEETEELQHPNETNDEDYKSHEPTHRNSHDHNNNNEESEIVEHSNESKNDKYPSNKSQFQEINNQENHNLQSEASNDPNKSNKEYPHRELNDRSTHDEKSESNIHPEISTDDKFQSHEPSQQKLNDNQYIDDESEANDHVGKSNDEEYSSDQPSFKKLNDNNIYGENKMLNKYNEESRNSIRSKNNENKNRNIQYKKYPVAFGYHNQNLNTNNANQPIQPSKFDTKPSIKNRPLNQQEHDTPLRYSRNRQPSHRGIHPRVTKLYGISGVIGNSNNNEQAKQPHTYLHFPQHTVTYSSQPVVSINNSLRKSDHPLPRTNNRARQQDQNEALLQSQQSQQYKRTQNHLNRNISPKKNKKYVDHQYPDEIADLQNNNPRKDFLPSIKYPPPEFRARRLKSPSFVKQAQNANKEKSLIPTAEASQEKVASGSTRTQNYQQQPLERISRVKIPAFESFGAFSPTVLAGIK